MNLEEITKIWHANDEQLLDTVSINKQLLTEVTTKRVQSRLYEIKWTAYFELVVESFWIIFLEGFLVDHFWEIQYSIPAGFLLLIAIFSMILNGSRLHRFYQLDASKTVLETQRQVEYLRYLELFDNRSLYVIMPLFATPFLIVVAKAFFNFELYSWGDILWNFTIGSFVVAFIIGYLLNRYPSRAIRETLDFLKEIKETNAL
jgi:hypothetical protein